MPFSWTLLDLLIGLTFDCEKMLPALVAEHYFGISLTALRLNKSTFSIDLAPKFHLKRLLGRTLASPILIASAERAEKTVVPEFIYCGFPVDLLCRPPAMIANFQMHALFRRAQKCLADHK